MDLQKVGCGGVAQDRDRWRPLVNVKFGTKTNHEHTSAISITYCLHVNKICDTLGGLLQLTERHRECCRLHSAQLTDEANRARRNGKDLE